MSSTSAPVAARVAIVTGGAKGIGWATVEALAAAGAMPVLFDRDAPALAAAGEALAGRGVEHLAEHVDITDQAAVDAAFEKVAARCGRIDVLVNNAGIARRHPTLEMSRSDWQAVVGWRALPEPVVPVDAITFLASDRARLITGHTLPVDGGYLAQ